MRNRLNSAVVATMLGMAGWIFVTAPAAEQTVARQPVAAASAKASGGSYERARWNPLHFKPAIETATSAQCLACHQEVIESKPREASPAGLRAADALAWYQTLDTYAGDQETFHRRHLVTPLARRLMDMKCTTCHQGHDPRERAPRANVEGDPGFTLRKTVDPKTCLMCHGRFPYQVMNLPGEWREVADTMSLKCVTCHAAFRTVRHQVNFLNAEAIEAAGQETSDACYGCHGGRAWYRISYPYPRHAWPGMPPETPEWARNRPPESEPRFRKPATTAMH